ncbi:hypothetical protein MUN78_07220 [Leucobacter allii]|uniref:Type II toxin-antitoxin system PemK/MazF family toxin n=1 Tax=Leucobacter allii TaxID=2932247 RepID=A0ABY4FQZ5_9MICO|nr:hypothetical protein [Leucobacter allii]UOQ58604.1 hypothetical protein MUN78_07220 [Leucobacter allii]
MSGGAPRSGWIADFLRSFVSAFLRSSRRSAPTAEPVPSAHPGSRSRDSAPADAESPGRSGDGATRELTASEIRALRPSYDPAPDGRPDPGEIVWTWVPYEENDGRGKDRPVLIIARIDARTTAACYLSTKPHRGFVSVGTGGWDGQGRESFLAPDRVLRVADAGMRREGHVLPRDRFARAVGAAAALHGFPGVPA